MFQIIKQILIPDNLSSFKVIISLLREQSLQTNLVLCEKSNTVYPSTVEYDVSGRGTHVNPDKHASPLWLPPVIPAGVDQITSHLTVSVDLFFAKLNGR